MGGKISKEQMQELRKTTRNRLTKKEIEKYHKFWYELYPNGEMTKDGFSKFAKLALPNWNGESDVEYLFRAMDQNKDGTVTFKEFLFFQSITSPSSEPMNPMELIDLAFDMYDEDGDGFVTVDEMRECLHNMFKAKGMQVSTSVVQSQIDNRINNLLNIADKNRDGKLTKEEIFLACEKDPQIVAMF
ncbi:hypothetical protein FDP41_010258 [Naegleria fowleri]|uniref:EF-hand domain-containing protein n=1 Tax=Naegleria fowleri TaxID=5763 RepID=A0A6A5BYI2_NAEFO|nr:uncharacterized protein FDP41_010258 [Naegleria fowleri]KAF0983193.1 hypothetical protein FDP41_010258 [Naegleria fowleri]